MGNIEPGSDLVITGWGRITNNNHGTKKAYLEHSVATRTLRKVELPLTIPGTKVDNNCNSSNNTIQFCAGGQKGNSSLIEYEIAIIIGNMICRYFCIYSLTFNRIRFMQWGFRWSCDISKDNRITLVSIGHCQFWIE